MKKVLFASALALFTLTNTVTAQSANEEVDMVQAMFGMEKKAFISEFIQLDELQAETFWTMYDEYESKRKELGKRRIALLTAYAEGYLDMDDTATSEMLSEMMSLQMANDKLLTSYTKKIKSKTNVKTAAQFYQIEGYILSKIRSGILENIPMIGEK